MKSSHIFFVTAFWIGSVLTTAASVQESRLSFEYLNVMNGLSQMSVTAIVQDDVKRVWIGTRDGVNMYDGNHMKVYRSMRGDATSLLGNEVIDLTYANEAVWVATREGISCLDVRKQTFKRFPFSGVKALVLIGNTLYFGTDKQLYAFDVVTWEAKRIDIGLDEKFYVRDLYRDVAGFLWVCTNKGLFRKNLALDGQVLFAEGDVSTVFVDSQKRIWVGTNGEGVYLFSKQNNLLRHFTAEDEENPLSHNVIRAINEDADGTIWIGTFLGLSVLDAYALDVEIYRQDDDANPISNNSIYCIMKDHQGTMWLGTYFGGISYSNRNDQTYVSYKIDAESDVALSYPVVSEIMEDEDGSLWIATEGGGLNHLDKRTGSVKHYMHTGSGISYNNVKCVIRESENALLFGSHMGGLCRLNTKTGAITRFMHHAKDPHSLPNNVVNDILPYGKNFLLGTHAGLVLFSPQTGHFRRFFEDNGAHEGVGKHIRLLFEDSFGCIWIGTEKQGLFAFDPKTQTLKRYFYDENNYNSIANNTVVSVLEDHQFRLWLGTSGGGLSLYNRDKDNFTTYNQENSNLSGDFVCGIVESRFGHMWISTTKGITWFDIDKGQGQSILSHDGFPLSELNYGALLLTRSGEIFVGGIDGLVSFNEEKLFKLSHKIRLSFSSLTVNNKEVRPNDESGILTEEINVTQAIKLSPQDKSFTLYFSDCSYQNAFRMHMRYRLEKDGGMWVDAGKRRSASFVNPAPGKYTFRLQVLSNIDNEVLDERTLGIHIMSPLYRRWYAFLFYAVLLSVFIFWRNKNYLAKERLLDSLKDEQREKQQIKELNRSKLRFFTNISHEFRTPLTLIVGSIEMILDDTRSSSRHYQALQVVQSNAKRLNYLISELLDFRKMEQGHLHLHVEKCSTTDFFQKIYDSFRLYALRKEVDFSLKMKAEGILWMDVVQMEKVIYNLLSNAFKAVPANGAWVVLEVTEQSDSMAIIVRNNGKILTPKQAERVFDRFYRIDHLSSESSGIGLAFTKAILQEHHGKISVSSSPEEGTTFTVSLLKGNKHYSKDQLQKVKRSGQALEGALQLSESFNDAQSEMVLQNQDHKTKLLVVEDNEEMRHLVKSAFVKQYHVLEAENGKVGLQKAIEEQPDLIISDVMMPHMSGTEMCKKLRRNEQTSHIPIILLTARTAVEHRIEGAESGADEYISKPFSMRLLKANVKNLIARKAALQERYKDSLEVTEKEVATNTIDTQLMEKARSIVEAHLEDEDFDVVAFAKEMGVGRTRLFSKIKGVTGQTPNEFILSIRLKKAAHLLLSEEEVNISEVAYMVGFNTPRYFSLCFKEHFGITPSVYIKQAQSKKDV